MHFFRGSCGGPHKASFSRIDHGYLQRVRERRGEEMQRAREREIEWVERGCQNQKMEGLQNQSFSKANFLYKMHFFQRLVWGPHKASFSRIDYGCHQRVRERRGEEMQRATGEM